MFYYKRQQALKANKENKLLWYPVVVANRSVISTHKIAREISASSGATEGDVIGILHDLGRVMREHLSEGDRVVLNGIGSFKLSANARGEGVETKEQVTAQQFNKLSVHFTPEATSSRALGIKNVTLIAPELIKFAPIEEASASLRKKSKQSEGQSGGSSTPSGGSGSGSSGSGSGFDGH